MLYCGRLDYLKIVCPVEVITLLCCSLKHFLVVVNHATPCSRIVYSLKHFLVVINHATPCSIINCYREMICPLTWYFYVDRRWRLVRVECLELMQPAMWRGHHEQNSFLF